MLPILVKLHIASSAMAAMSGMATPGPVMEQVVEATLVATHFTSPIAVHLYDENEHQEGTLAVWRDGTTDDATKVQLKKLFHDRKTGYQKLIAKNTIAMLAAVGETFDKTVEYVSALRVARGEPWESPHRAGRAVDFRIRGVSLVAIRDFLWKSFTHVGVGWYPSEQFIHIDTRPDENDCAWTFYNGSEHYHPYWAEAVRQPPKPARPDAHARKAGS
jgi:uncharacterized protein YcbK (DUF882 family)